MNDALANGGPPALRALIAADLAPVRPLSPPLVRSLMLLPVAIALVATAPLTFDVRPDLARLGWALGWGASGIQVVLGLAVMSAALREAVPGRTWSRTGLTGWLALVACAVVAITLASFAASPVRLRGAGIEMGILCLIGTVIIALPAVTIGSVLAAWAWPTRPAVAGLLAGLGGGLISDAGWRIFCHVSQPAHVFAAHTGGVIIAGALGAGMTVWLSRRLLLRQVRRAPSAGSC